MPLQLLPAVEANALRIANIEHAAYGRNPTNDVLFPGPFPEGAGVDSRAASLVKELREDSTVRWLKVVDTDLDAGADGDANLLGFAQWHIRANGEPLSPAREFAGEGINLEACNTLFGAVHDMRNRIMGDRKHVHLRLLFVDPKAQRRGIGKMLVMWGVEEAQRLGLPAFLESSEEGYALYTRCGFRDVEKFVMDCSKWGVEDSVTVVAMVKPVDGQTYQK